MAIDTVQKRMSAISPGSPWRGPLVDAPASGFDISSRAAAMFLYGFVAGAAVGLTIGPPIFFTDPDTLYPPIIGLGEPPQYYPPEVSMRSGFQVPAGSLIKEWTGLFVSRDDLDIRNPQDFVRGVPPVPPRKPQSPEPPGVFVGVNSVGRDDF